MVGTWEKILDQQVSLYWPQACTRKLKPCVAILGVNQWKVETMRLRLLSGE